MEPEAPTTPGRPEDGHEVRRQQAQPGPALHHPSGAAPVPPSLFSSFTTQFAHTQTHGNRYRLRFPISMLVGQHAPGFLYKVIECWKVIWKDFHLRDYRETFVSVVAFAALVMAGVTLWPTITSTNDGRKSEQLAEWTARKDFLSNCEEHNWPSPSCDTARSMQLEAPPNFDRSGWKRYLTPDWGSTIPQLYADEYAAQHNSTSFHLLVTLLSFPACGSLSICIFFLRKRKMRLPYRIRELLRNFTNLQRRLCIANKAPKRRLSSHSDEEEDIDPSSSTASGAYIGYSQGPTEGLRYRYRIPPSHQEEKKELRREKETLSKAVVDLNEEMRELQRGKEQLDRAVVSFNEDIERLSHEKEKLHDATFNLHEEKRELRREKETLSKAVIGLSEEKAELHHEKERLNGTVVGLSKDIEMLVREKEDSRGDVDLLKEEVERLAYEEKSLLFQKESLRNAVVDLNNNYKELQKANDWYADENARLKAETDRQRTENYQWLRRRHQYHVQDQIICDQSDTIYRLLYLLGHYRDRVW
ncbi:hypothetical protein PG991_011751 [Apiospora marii]|uniref:Uncharacterized protein n=1 Tax=Apiospora marii TaxID=335849 RepID=A0ABR1RFF5_9PEZI